MNDNHRLKDYYFPRSMREAFGNDQTFEPEIRCISETWGIRKPKSNIYTFVALFSFAAFICVVVKLFAH